MSYGKKCNIIFVRKVGNRLNELEEKYKGLTVKKRAAEISKELLHDFCVEERQMRRWKQIVETADNLQNTLTDINVRENIVEAIRPTTLYEIARLPKGKQVEVAKEVIDKQLTAQQTRNLVNQILSSDNPVKIPKGKFRTIIVDPPWPVKKIIREVRPNQEEELDYQTLTVEQIKALPIKQCAYDDGCHVYLWTTHKFLPVAFEVFRCWGVNYECVLTWVKNVGFTPYSWMYSTEHVLFGRIGSLELLEKGLRLDFNGKVREHSRKPDEFYDLVRKVSPEPRRDMFSREKRDGFEQWGNELDKFRRMEKR
jgi:N6-adenosine-specific RNA methylase IME4